MFKDIFEDEDAIASLKEMMGDRDGLARSIEHYHEAKLFSGEIKTCNVQLTEDPIVSIEYNAKTGHLLINHFSARDSKCGNSVSALIGSFAVFLKFINGESLTAIACHHQISEAIGDFMESVQHESEILEFAHDLKKNRPDIYGEFSANAKDIVLEERDKRTVK
jgi:hypothetical protein